MLPSGVAKKAPGEGNPPTFEAALAQLEEIIERIEAGELGLEDSIKEYERGVGLVRRCREVLDTAQQRVEELGKALENPSGATTAGRPPREADTES